MPDSVPPGWQDFARRIEELERKLAEEREAREQLEGRLQLHQAQLLELSRSLRSILGSRIWRVLRSAGGGLLSADAFVTRSLRGTLRTLRRPPSRLHDGPLISVLMPVFETPEKWLRRSIESVLAQNYANWELCVADDHSTRPHVRTVLEEYRRQDARVRVLFRQANGHIAEATNSCLELAQGEFIALLDHDDELEPDALSEITAALASHPDADVIYTDEDKIDDQEYRFDTFFKPDWSPEYLLGCMYTGHLSAYRTALVRNIGGFRSEVNGAQDYDLALRASLETQRIVHVHKVLYHWRVTEGSMASGVGAKDYAYASAASALKHFLHSSGFEGEVCQGSRYGTYRVRIDVAGNPCVEVRVIVSGEPEDLVRRTVSHIRSVTDWPNLQIRFCGDAGGEPPADFIVLLRAGTEVSAPDWITRLVEFCQLPGVGAAGPRVLGPDGKVQSAGILFVGGRLMPAYAGHEADDPGYFLSAQVPRNYLAVSGACLATKGEVFRELAGLDSALSPELGAIDYCLRLYERGMRTVFTPHAEIRRPAEAPLEVTPEFRLRWGHYLRSDPYYNPNLPRNFAYHPPR
jgi:GT2 family glycosyltransferase